MITYYFSDYILDLDPFACGDLSFIITSKSKPCESSTKGGRSWVQQYTNIIDAYINNAYNDDGSDDIDSGDVTMRIR